MKGKTSILGKCILAMFIISFFCGVSISGDTVTILGKVTRDFKIVTDDNKVYEIGDNEKADELVQYIDKNVIITGIIENVDGFTIIYVISYNVIE